MNNIQGAFSGLLLHRINSKKGFSSWMLFVYLNADSDVRCFFGQQFLEVTFLTSLSSLSAMKTFWMDLYSLLFFKKIAIFEESFRLPNKFFLGSPFRCFLLRTISIKIDFVQFSKYCTSIILRIQFVFCRIKIPTR